MIPLDSTIPTTCESVGYLCGQRPIAVSPTRAAALISSHLAARGRSKVTQKYLIGALSLVATRGREVNLAFDTYVRVLTTERDEVLREAAAKCLPSLVDLSPPRHELPMALSPIQLRAVADLLRAEKNPKVVPYLQEMISKMNAVGKP